MVDVVGSMLTTTGAGVESISCCCCSIISVDIFSRVIFGFLKLFGIDLGGEVGCLKGSSVVCFCCRKQGDVRFASSLPLRISIGGVIVNIFRVQLETCSIKKNRVGEASQDIEK